MPGIVTAMELESSPPPSTTEQAEARRKSGRATRKPEYLVQDPSAAAALTNGSAKRKRTSTAAVANEEGDEQDDASDSEDESEASADEEELREKRRAARKKTSKPPAQKKARVANGNAVKLPMRPAAGGRKTSKSTKSRPRPRQSYAANEEGLYAEVFGRGHSADAVAAQWLTSFEEDNLVAVRDTINFILRCTGAQLQIESHDIEDVDNATSRVADLLEEYQAQGISEYPLISRAKQYTSFRATLTDFFDSLIQTLHSSSVLYENEGALYENLQAWLAPLSSAAIRPFRHTATVISLTVSSALCDIAEDLTSTISTTRKQLESEKKKKTVNKGRISELQAKVLESQGKLDTVDRYIKDLFDVVFSHRYRDVDPKIRADCISALGYWITTYRAMFFEGQYLRYLGWVLSDTVAHTRAEVVKQLYKLFRNKDNIPNLSAFTDKFRPRLVEMAARDAEPGVRASTVELLDLMRDAELLEPNDMETIGRLIFDAEPRVRKAVAKFFVSHIYDSFTEDTEDIDDLDDFFPSEDDDSLEEPRQAWIKFKILVDRLQAFDEDADGDDDQESKTRSIHGLVAEPGVDSRYVLATQAIYPHMSELEEWESLAAYLLYDHSQIEEPSDGDDSAAKVRMLYKLDEGQEVILLGVLDCAVKLHLLNLADAGGDRKGKKLKLSRDDARESQELTAHRLAQIIPQLLSKFGAVPDAASAVLRLGQLLNFDLIEDLQQDSSTYAALLDDINKQFLTHSDHNVLAEASVALLHAKTSEELREATDGKLQELWDDSIESLHSLAQNAYIDTRGKLSDSEVVELSNTVLRISNLSSIDDCVSIFEKIPSLSAKQKKGKAVARPPLEVLLDVAKHGIPSTDEIDEEVDQQEDELTTYTLKTILFYFMWKIKSLTTSIKSGMDGMSLQSFEELAGHRDNFAYTLTSIMQERTAIDDLRLYSTMTLLDLQTLFITLRRAEPVNGSLPTDLADQIQVLIQEIPAETQAVIVKIHDLAEKSLAKRLGRSLEPADDEDPMDSDEEPEASDDEDEDDSNHRGQAALLVEKKLCELTGKMVLAIFGRVIDASGKDKGRIRQRLLRNKNKLGQNYKQVLAYLDVDERKGSAVTRASATATAKGGRKDTPTSAAAGANQDGKFKSAELVVEDDDIEDSDNEEAAARVVEDDDEEDLRARGLIEDEIEDDDDNEGEGGSEKGNELSEPPESEEDEIMGD